MVLYCLLVKLSWYKLTGFINNFLSNTNSWGSKLNFHITFICTILNDSFTKDFFELTVSYCISHIKWQMYIVHTHQLCYLWFDLKPLDIDDQSPDKSDLRNGYFVILQYKAFLRNFLSLYICFFYTHTHTHTQTHQHTHTHRHTQTHDFTSVLIGRDFLIRLISLGTKVIYIMDTLCNCINIAKINISFPFLKYFPKIQF